MPGRVTLIGCIASALVVAACGTTPQAPVTGNATVSLSRDIQPIFNTNCVICHQGVGQTVPGGLSLAAGGTYANLVNVQSIETPVNLVTPGHPEKSYLINKLAGTQMEVGGIGVRMPYDRTPLTNAQMEIVTRWILEGAPNN